MNSCAILGAGGHGKVVAEIAELNGYETISFFDDSWPEKQYLENWPVIGDSSALLASTTLFDKVFIAIGDNRARLDFYLKHNLEISKLTALIHPNAIVSKYAKIGAGSIVMAGAIINPFASVGVACIINTGATVDHDCKIGDAVHLSPGVHLAGAVQIADASWVGIGSEVKQSIMVGESVMVGAGSTVVKDIPDKQTVMGVPAIIKFK